MAYDSWWIEGEQLDVDVKQAKRARGCTCVVNTRALTDDIAKSDARPNVAIVTHGRARRCCAQTCAHACGDRGRSWRDGAGFELVSSELTSAPL